MTLIDLLQSFLHSRKHGLSGAKGRSSAQTLDNYKRFLTPFVDFMMSRGRLKYEELERADIRAYIEHVNNNRKWKSESTKLTMLRPLRTLFRFVEQDEECLEEKLRSWTKLLPAIPSNARRIHIPTPKDLRTFSNDWETKTPLGFRNFALTSFMLATGLRVGEICHTRMEHLQLDDNLVYVPEEGKTGSRLVPLDSQIVKILQIWIKRRNKLKGAAASPYLFISRGGHQCNRNTLGQAFRRLQPGSKAGKRITPHTLRHSFGTYYLRNGGNMESLRMITGHKTYDAMKGYLHLAQVGSDAAKKELDRVSPLKMISGIK